MSDNLHKKHPQDSSKVNVHENWEVKYWCEKWNISKEKLIAAVKAVGVSSSAIQKYLGK